MINILYYLGKSLLPPAGICDNFRCRVQAYCEHGFIWQEGGYACWVYSKSGWSMVWLSYSAAAYGYSVWQLTDSAAYPKLRITIRL